MKPKDTVEEFWNSEIISNCSVNHQSDSVEKFRLDFSQYLNVNKKSVHFFSSGRVGLTALLKSIHANGKTEVLVSAFNCSVVAESVVNAGYEVKTYDLGRLLGTLDLNLIEEQISDNTAAVVITHFFGIPSKFDELIALCKRKGVVIIEDCAHTLGAKIDNRIVGTIGDASIFSFNYDKPISLGWGGAIVLNNDDMFSVTDYAQVSAIEPMEELQLLRDFYRVMQVRRDYISNANSFLSKIQNRLLGNGKRTFKIPDVSIGPVRAELGCWQLSRYQEIVSVRNDNASMLIERINGIDSWFVDKGVSPAWLKLRVLPHKIEKSSKIAKTLQNNGIRVGNFNWGNLIGRDWSMDWNSYKISKCALDVPVHQNLFLQDLDTIVRGFETQ